MAILNKFKNIQYGRWESTFEIGYLQYNPDPHIDAKHL